MKSCRKFVALMLMLWTPLFFSGAAYAATQMELADVGSNLVVTPQHSCHEMDAKASAEIQDLQHDDDASNCHHCSFCLSFAAPIQENKINIISQHAHLAPAVKWTSLTHKITPDHRPPIDA